MELKTVITVVALVLAACAVVVPTRGDDEEGVAMLHNVMRDPVVLTNCYDVRGADIPPRTVVLPANGEATVDRHWMCTFQWRAHTKIVKLWEAADAEVAPCIQCHWTIQTDGFYRRRFNGGLLDPKWYFVFGWE